MPDLFETRCVSEQFRGSHNLVRIACIGDSMMYGQGSPRHQAFPAHLERLLNGAWLDDLVWVDNFGQTSGNLWHAWPRMKLRAQRQTFDAIVFSVCQNDAQIFESATVAYPEDARPTWAPGTIHLKAVRDLFTDVAAFSRFRKIPVIILYYSFIQRDKPIIEGLEGMMAELRLPFVNMLKFYTEETGVTPATYKASEFDGHPSGMAHELAARCVTRELLDRADLLRPGLFGKDPSQVLEAALADLIDQRVAVDAALDWAQEAVAAKGRAARRRERTDLAEACAEMPHLVADCQRRWRLARNVDAVMRATLPPEPYMQVWLPNLYASAQNLEEFVSHFENSADSDALAQFNALFAEDGYYNGGRVSFFTGSARDEIQGVKARLGNLKVLHPDSFQLPDGWLLRASPQLRDSLDLGAVRPDLALLQLDMARFAGSLHAIEALAQRFDPELERPEVRRIWAIMLSYVDSFVTYLEWLERDVLARAAAGLGSDAALTCIDVTLEGGPDPEVAGRVCGLIVESDYLVPERGRLREKHWAGVAKDRAVYHFELPLMVLGTLRVGVAAHEPTRERFLRGTTRLAEIRIYNSGTRGVAAENIRAHDTAVTWADADSRLPLIEFPNLLLLGGLA